MNNYILYSPYQSGYSEFLVNLRALHQLVSTGNKKVKTIDESDLSKGINREIEAIRKRFKRLCPMVKKYNHALEFEILAESDNWERLVDINTKLKIAKPSKSPAKWLLNSLKNSQVHLELLGSKSKNGKIFIEINKLVKHIEAHFLDAKLQKVNSDRLIDLFTNASNELYRTKPVDKLKK